jgi:nitrogen regulatory protein PII-like uncharacterized protein
MINMAPYQIVGDPKAAPGTSLIDNTTAEQKLRALEADNIMAERDKAIADRDSLASVVQAKNNINKVGNQMNSYGLSNFMVADALGVKPEEVGDYLNEIDYAAGESVDSAAPGAPAMSSDAVLQQIAAKYEADVNNMIRKNKEYNANRAGAKPVAPSADDIAFYANDGVDAMRMYEEGLADYMNKKAAEKAYESNVDPVLAAKWRRFSKN